MPEIKLRVFQLFLNLKFSPSPTTCIFHIVFLQKTVYSYSLQYFRHLEIDFRYRSNSTSCTHFGKELDFWFRFPGVPLYSLYVLDICRNLMLLVKIMKKVLKLSLSHTCLTGFWKKVHGKMKHVICNFWKNTYTVTIIKIFQTNFYNHNRELSHFLFRMGNFSSTQGVGLVSRGLELLVE